MVDRRTVLVGALTLPVAAQAQESWDATVDPRTGTLGKALPPLAGQPKDQLLQSLKDFKAGKRPATIMTQLAKGYTEIGRAHV